MKLSRFFYTCALIFLFQFQLTSQILDCPKAKELDDEIAQLTSDYKLEVKELQAGLYCSECKNAKSEIEKNLKIPFEEHLTNVRGKAIPASQEMLDKAEEDYLDKFNALGSQYLRAKDYCKEEADRIAKAEADKKEADKKEADRKAQEEADRKAKAEADRLAKEEADRKAREEAIRAFVAQEQARMAEESVRRDEKYEQLIENAKNNLASATNKVIGGVNFMKSSAKDLFSNIYNAAESYSVYSDLDVEDVSMLVDFGSYISSWRNNDMIDNLIDAPIIKSVLKFGQDENIKDTKGLLEDSIEGYAQQYYDAGLDLSDISNDSGASRKFFENLPEDVRTKVKQVLKRVFFNPFR